MPNTIPSWSISRIQVFEQCAYRAKLQWLDKIPDLQPKTAADRGSAIHLEAENYVQAKGDLTHNLRHFAPDLAALKAHHAEGRVTVEEEWAFDRDWRVSEWKSGWLRLKCDAVCHLSKNHLVVIDHKTGKRFGNEIKHAVQLQLYAVCALIRYPEVEQVTCELWYLDQNELASFVLHRRQLASTLPSSTRRVVNSLRPRTSSRTRISSRANTAPITLIVKVIVSTALSSINKGKWYASASPSSPPKATRLTTPSQRKRRRI